jgi:hypothetical protein
MTRSFRWLALLATACSGDTTEPANPEWWTTCGDPVCSSYSGPFDGVPVCTDEQIAGTACDDEGAQCDLESNCNVLLQCSVADPKGGSYGGCPISVRSAKTDIHYLDDPALRATADEARRVKLATWFYKDEPQQGRPHLGFVIDDQPASPAVAADGRHVDLYGYTSLAIAALQVQQAEIEALRAEVEELRAGTCPDR